MKKTFIFCLLSLMSFFSFGQDPTPSESTGEKIGTIIKTAISTALHGVSELVNIIWPKTNPNKVNKEKLKESVEASNKALKDALVANFQEKLNGVSDIQKEIDIVKQFLIPTEVTKVNMARIVEKLNAPDVNWNSIVEEWDIAKTHLITIKNVDTKQIRDKWLRTILNKITTAQNNIIIRINNSLSSKNIENAKRHFFDLNNIVEDVSQTMVFQLDNLSSEFLSLSQWAKGDAGPSKLSSQLSTSIKTKLGSKYPE